MCIFCTLAGKSAGSAGCLDAETPRNSNSTASDTSKASAGDAVAYASFVTDSGNHDSLGSDTVAGSTVTSSTLSVATAVTGYVNTAGDQDWYRVNLVAGHQYTFELDGFGKAALTDPFLHLFNAAGSEIASDDDSGPLYGSKLTFTAPASGSYYIAAAGYSSATGEYLLTMNEGSTAFKPAVSVADAADYLVDTYWEATGSRDRHWASHTVSYNLDALAPGRAALAQTALQLWSDVSGLNFVQTHGNANITFDETQPGSYSASDVGNDGLITSSIVNVNSTWYGASNAVDSYTLQTFIHEIGHAIGLGHDGGYNGSATYGVDNVYANDTWQMSVMSYMPQADFGNATYRFVMTPMMADIMAVQEMYGAPSTRAGDTVYGFGSTAGAMYDFSTYSSAPALTIYDSGGNDTPNASGYGQNQLIDLRPGDFSNIGGLTGNVSVYLTTVIENAIGGLGERHYHWQ